MTLFIPLVNFSTWDQELKLALRSWEMYGPEIKTLLIIGHKPDWIANVHHIPFDDKRGKVENIFNKVKLAAQHYPEFIFANDDHFLLQPLRELPYYYSSKLKDYKGSHGDTFFRYVDTTRRLFPDGKYFDIHVPMICKREVIDKLTWKPGVLFKSYYCNTEGIEGEQMNDCAIRGFIRRPEVERYVVGRRFVATTESISMDLKKYLLERFPNPSIFERV